jgi:hypothetical protein
MVHLKLVISKDHPVDHHPRRVAALAPQGTLLMWPRRHPSSDNILPVEFRKLPSSMANLVSIMLGQIHMINILLTLLPMDLKGAM